MIPSKNALARLHWFWRAAIAIFLACVYAGISIASILNWLKFLAGVIAATLGSTSPPSWQLYVAVTFVYFLPALLIAFAIYGWLTMDFGPKSIPLDCCRQCGYDLAGNVGGRCPVCGDNVTSSKIASSRLHWFWRTAMAIFLACAYATVSIAVLRHPLDTLAESMVDMLGGGSKQSWQSGVGVSIVYFLPVFLIAFAIYGWLTKRFGPRSIPPGCCRQCGYNLTGNVSGRCPECGEAVSR